MKKILSIALATLMVFSLGVIFATAATPIASVTVERTLEPGGIGNQSLYRFKATPLDAGGNELKGDYTYKWSVSVGGTELDSVSYSHEQARNFFAIQPPYGTVLPATFEVKCAITSEDGTVSDEQSFTLYAKLPESAKDPLKAAIAQAAFRSESLYTTASWNRMLTCYYEACELYKDASLSEGATVGGESDVDRIKRVAQNLINASTVNKSGDGLIVDPEKEDGFLGIVLPIFEKITAVVWSLTGLKLGGLEIPYSSGMLGGLF
ncbi:MAG: hypothetical protein LBQ80_00085 [Clostridium sp.]|jgi:hypothetical protein|nr:hypothetical protein [Clostridium sp.]